MTNPRATVGKNVRESRERLGISQEELAEAAGVHRTYIGQVERGETNISLMSLVRIAKALKKRASDLLAGV